MLELQLGVHDDAVGELIAGVQHETQVVREVAVAARLIAHVLAVKGLTIAADRQASLDAVNLGGRRSQAVYAVFHGQRLEVGHSQAGAQVFHFLGQQAGAPGGFFLLLLSFFFERSQFLLHL